MENQVLTAIADRRSIRAYKDQEVTQEQIDRILEAAGQSPSARNGQPWFLSVVRNQELIKEINSEIIKNSGRDQTDIFYGAPLVIFISCDYPNNKWAMIDSGIIVQTIALAAHSLGLGSVILGYPAYAFEGEEADKIKDLLKMPDGYVFAIAIAIGVPATTKDAHPVLPDKICFID